jgi:hypothetical protein
MTASGAVWLGHYVVATERLDERGHPLDDLLGSGGELSIDHHFGPPPVEGWRLIHGVLPEGSTVDMKPIVIAAPWEHELSNGWMTVSVARPDGSWVASILVDTNPVVPYIEPSVRWREASQLFDSRWQVQQLQSHDGGTDAVRASVTVEFRPGRDTIGVGTYNAGERTGDAAGCDDLGNGHLEFGNWSNDLIHGGTDLSPAQRRVFFEVLDGTVRWSIDGDHLTFDGSDGARIRMTREVISRLS